jgi:hypothetical protein
MADTYDFQHHDPRFPGTYQLLLDIAKDPKASAAIKVAALAAASKVEPKYLNHPIDLPAFTTISEAENFKLQLTRQELRNEYDRDSVNRAIARIDNWINDQRQDQQSARADAELELKRLQADVSDQPQIIKIEGGLPPLPGTNVTMPNFNGHVSDGLLPPFPVVPETMTTKDNGFICTWIKNEKGGYDLKSKYPDPAYASPGPALNGSHEEPEA